MWKKFTAALLVAAFAIGPVVFWLVTIFTNVDFDTRNSSGSLRHNPGMVVIFWPVVAGFMLALLLRAFPWTRKHFSVTRKEASPMYGLGVILVATGAGLSMVPGILVSGIHTGTVLGSVSYFGALLFLFGLSYTGAVLGMSPVLKME